MTTIYVFPGQGSQQPGMGAELFDKFSELSAAADEILGYSLKDLCLAEDDSRLSLTAYTQPALFTVNALTYKKKLEEAERPPDFVAGHSLGEYNALLASGAFDFATGLELVQKRGEIMSRAEGGGMAAIIGITVSEIELVLADSGHGGIDIANYNAPSQTVISGMAADVEAARTAFEDAGARMFVPLDVSGAFHSRYMEPAASEFGAFMQGFEFGAMKIPVISNVTAQPCPPESIAENLQRQINNSVRWTESVQYLLEQPEPDFEEIGPGRVLTGLIRKIRAG